MEKSFLKNDEFIKSEQGVVASLTWFQKRHERAESTNARILRGQTLNRLSNLIDKIAARGTPWQILSIERHCEQFYLAYLAKTDKEKQASIQALQTLSRLRGTLNDALNPAQYIENLKESIGEKNMGNLPTAALKDEFHLFVTSQSRRLEKAPGQFATPPETGFFAALRNALKAALKQHEKNCAKALGIESKPRGSSLER